MKCKHCNQEILENANFCSNCGSNIEQNERVIEANEHNEIGEVVELLPLNLNTQRNSNLNKKILLVSLAIAFIISISAIVLYNIFTDKGTEKKDYSLIGKSNTDESESPKKEYDDFPVTVQEAISIAEKVITSGRVEVLSDRIRKDGKFYYEVAVFREIENRTVKEGTLYIDKETGDVFMLDKLDPTNPWIAVNGMIEAPTHNQESDTQVGQTTPDTPVITERLTQGEYYAKITGSWTDNNEKRIYAKEGYYVNIGGLDMITGDFSITTNKDEINEILKYYREEMTPNVFTKPKTQIVAPQTYDINKFEDIFTDTDLEKAIIVNIKNNKEDSIYKPEYKELIIFTSDDYRQCKVYILETGANIVLKEVGDFFKTTKQPGE